MLIPLLAAVVCLAIGFVLVLVKKDARHLLAPALVPLALVPSVLAVAQAALYMQMAFGQSAATGAGVGAMGELLIDVARTTFFARLCSLVLLVLAALLVLRGLGGTMEAPQPRGRGVVLLVGALVAVGMALLIGWSEGRVARTVVLALLPAEQFTPAAEAEMKELVTGSPTGERLHMRTISAFLGRQILLLTYAAPALALAFVALTGILAAVGWRPPRAGSPHGPALALVLVIAVVGAWTSSAYGRLGRMEAFARAFDESQARRAAETPAEAAPSPPVVQHEPDVPDPAVLARCEAGDARACSTVGRSMEDGPRVALYDRACAKAGGEVCADLASLHLNGIGTAADPARAKALYERACRTGDTSACGLFEQLSKRAAP
ncbi:MAG: hypothetical protein ABW221_02600 [Vicinamibacteria bacterium]